MASAQNKVSTKPSFLQSLLCILGIIFLVFFGLFVLKTSLQCMILLSVCWVFMHSYYLEQDATHIVRIMMSTLLNSVYVCLFFILIGAVIGAFTISGAIPTLIDYGLSFISPRSFLPIGVILCSMMSLAIGSCWGTIGTMGVALLGVASIFHIPLPMAAGMIVSGAYFGDKFSPISDTTVLSALTTETNLYKHIKGMTYSIIPAYVASLGIFWLIGRYYLIENDSFLSNIAFIRNTIHQHFHVGITSLTPMMVMLFLSITKKPAKIAMLVSTIVALLIAVFIQKINPYEVFSSVYSGPHIQPTGEPVLDAALSRGGILSMLWPMSLALLILMLGGLLETYQFITVLFTRMMSYLKSPIALVSATLLTSISCNILMGEAYLSIILTSRIFKKAFINMGLDSCVLSKTIEEGSTFSTPLIPWTTSGAFIATTLGVSPMDYLYWSIFNWIAPLAFLLLVSANFIGIKMYTKPQEPMVRLLY